VIALQSLAQVHCDGVQPRRANSRTLCRWKRLGHSNLLDVRYSGSMRRLEFFGGPLEAATARWESIATTSKGEQVLPNARLSACDPSNDRLDGVSDSITRGSARSIRPWKDSTRSAVEGPVAVRPCAALATL